MWVGGEKGRLNQINSLHVGSIIQELINESLLALFTRNTIVKGARIVCNRTDLKEDGERDE